MEESDHLLACPYCGVRHAVCFPSLPSYVLKQQKTFPGQFLVPYLRLRGSIFTCAEGSITTRVADLSIRAIPLEAAPISLGIRPQGVAMAFPRPDMVYLVPSLDMKVVVERALKKDSRERAFHRTLVGEVASVVYLPLLLEGERLIDGVSGRETGRVVKGRKILDEFPAGVPPAGPRLLPAVCPQCGWDLDGQGKSCVLLCKGCLKAWEIGPSGFSEVACLFGSCPEGPDQYLPFWRMTLDVSPPLDADPECPGGRATIWIPGFKLRPDLFLKAACRLSGAPHYTPRPGDIKKAETFPVTLPRLEGLEAARPVIYELTRRKRAVGLALSGMEISPLAFELWYLPFSATGHDLNCLCLPVTINRSNLRFGLGL